MTRLHRWIAIAVMLAAVGAARAAEPASCTWGGTPADPTGHVTLTPGLSNRPSSGPIALHADGVLGGGCSGSMAFEGEDLPGARCLLFVNHGDVLGLPGVARFFAAGNLAQEGVLIGDDGAIVGNYQVTVPPGAWDSLRTRCGTEEGITEATLSVTVELGIHA